MRPVTLRRVADQVLDGRNEVAIVSAMAPQQPDRLLRVLLREARARQIGVRLLLADTTARFRFLDEDAERDLAAGVLAITMLAGSVPRRLARLVDSVPVSLGEIDRLLAAGELACDVFAVRMQRDGSGGFELGNAVGYTRTMLARPGVTVAVEAAAPGAYVPGLCPADPELLRDAIVGDGEGGSPGPPASAQRAADEVRDRIAANLARIVPPDATLQVGIGSVAEALIGALAGRAGIGLHSGILPSALRARLAAGDFTGPGKTVDPGLAVSTALAPDAGAEPWPASLRLRPIIETHSHEALARHDRLWAINSAFSVDLGGQVNAEWVGGLKVACGAGQLDFARAAHASPGGASVIALPACTSQGRSRIVTRLDTVGAVTTPASEVDYVVTEYGVAPLTGCTLGERARALAAVTHPDYRAALLAQLEAG
jgi:4-hydroxybutyrate CoA-transferase